MSEFIEILSPSALKDLQTANSEVLTLIKNIDNAGKSMQNIKTPSGSDSAIKDLTNAYNQQAKTIQNLQTQLQQLAKSKQAVIVQSSNLAKTTATNTKNTRESAVANQILRTETDRQIRANTLLGGAYAKASAQLLILKKQAKDYAIALGETHPKTLQAIEDAKNLDSRIKDADKAVGDFQRNVGNYSGGIAGGFQAIYSKARILANILPGIGIAGIFGLALDPLLEYIKGLDIVSGKLHGLAEARKQINDTEIQAKKNAVEETLNLKILLGIAKDTTLSYEERSIAVKQLQETYPAYLGNLTKEQILAGDTAKAENQLTLAILSRAKATAAVEKITENQGKIIDLEETKLQLSKDLTNAKNRQADATARANKVDLQRGESGAYMAVDAISKREEIEKRIAKVQKEINDYTDLNNRLTNYALENKKKSIKLDYEQEKIKKPAKTKKEKAEEFQADVSSLKAMEQMIANLKEQQAGADLTSERYSALGSVISLLEETYKGLVDSMKPKETLLEMSKGVKDLTDETKLLSDSSNKVVTDLEAQRQQEIKNAETLAKLKEATDSFIASFSKGFLSSQGLGAFDQFFDGTFQQRLESLKQSGAEMKEVFALYFESIAESAQQTFNKIFELSNQQFENEKANLQKERDIAIAFAGESASAKEEINRQYDERQREIRNREAKAKKQQALFNIIIDTAQGVVSALASGNIPLSIAIGVIGALQAGIVASQPTPQFYKGTDNAPEGWAWTQEKGAEVITDKNGKLKSTGSNKGAQMTYLNKGDKVFTAEKSKLMFDNGLNNILSSNGISGSKIEVNTPNIDVSGVIKAIENKASVNLSIDKGGLNAFVLNGHSRKEITNRRINGIGQNV